MDTVDLSVVKKIGEEAKAATVEMHEMLKKGGKIFDVIDEAKLRKIDKVIDDYSELAQKTTLAFESEEKSRKEAQKKLDEVVAQHAELRKADQARVDALEVALKRVPIGETEKEAGLDKKWNSAFNRFAREGGDNIRSMKEFIVGADEFKDLSVGSQVDGGFLVMPTIGEMMKTREFETSPMRAYAKVVEIGNDAIEFPLNNDQFATGGWVAETQSRPNTGTAQIAMQRIPVNEQYANPRVTQKMLDDAPFDVEAFVADGVSEILTRTENTAFVIGDGNGKPRGFLMYPDLTTPGTFQNFATEQFASGTTGAITYDSFTFLQAGLKGSYQGNAKFFGKRATLGGLKRIKDGEGRPIFDMQYNGLNLQTPTFMGKEYVAMDDMPVVATGNYALAYGDMKQHYMIVDRIGIRILRDPFTNKPYIQFYTTKRVGGDVVNFEAMKLLRIS